MAFTNFCCRSGGSNLNAGTLTGDTTEPGTTASYTYSSGSWVQSTGVFTVASGDPSSDGVSVGDFASVYADGSTVTGFVGRITAVTTTTITVSLSAKSGTAPTDGTSNRTIKVGGAWEGPNGSEQFPFGFFNPQTCQNSSGDLGRVNLKNTATYNITTTLEASKNFWRVQGYSTSYGDQGRATIDGGSTGASYEIFNRNPSNTINPIASDLILQNNGATGSQQGVDGWRLERVTITGMVGRAGEVFGAFDVEAYNNGGGIAIREVGSHVISHGNSGNGITTNGATVLVNCISYDNTGKGIYLNGLANNHVAINCDSYNNTDDGIHIHANSYAPFRVENCNAIGNGGYGIGSNIGLYAYGEIRNCGFGAGTAANTSGQIEDVDGIIVSGSVTYTDDETPWNDPANGDFSISSSEAKNTGHNGFVQSESGESGTVGYPDIGAAAADCTGGGGGGIQIARGMHGGMRG